MHTLEVAFLCFNGGLQRIIKVVSKRSPNRVDIYSEEVRLTLKVLYDDTGVSYGTTNHMCFLLIVIEIEKYKKILCIFITGYVAFIYAYSIAFLNQMTFCLT